MRKLRHLAGRTILAIAAMLLTMSPAYAIVNGWPDDDEMFPNVGAIVVTKIPEAYPVDLDAPQAVATGTLVHPQVLLTAGHNITFLQEQIATFDDLSLSDYVVSFDPDVTGEEAFTSLEIDSLMLFDDPSVQENEVSHDLGAIILKDEAPAGIPLVNLPAIGEIDTFDLTVENGQGTPLLIAGFGATEESQGSDPPYTGFFNLPSGTRYWGIADFQALRDNDVHIAQNFAQDESGFSAGDSGGPAFYTDSDGNMIQIGYLSWGDGVGAEFTVHTRTDLEAVQTFIDDAKAIAESLP